MGRPGDRFEREADSMADTVVGRSPGTDSESGLFGRISPLVQRQAEEEPLQAQVEEEEETLQAQAEQEEEEPLQTQPEEEEETVQARVEDEEETVQAQAEEAEEEEAVQAQPEEEEETVQSQAQEEEETVQAQAEDEEEPVQAQAIPGPGPSPGVGVEEQLRAARGGGSPLPDTVRTRMEATFGADFSGVRIHTDGLAVQLTRLLKAQAFTHGRDIYFNEGNFAPGSSDGEHLLAHELTHTVQQGAVRSREIQLKSDPGSIQRAEDEQATIQIRPELLQAIKLARREIGKVNAKKTGADGSRLGWERLYEYFFTAFGEKELIHQDVIKFITQVKSPGGGKKDAMPSWCGIFVWWAFKKAGIPIPDWKLGTPILGQVVPRKPGELPRKGDIAYREKFDHFALVSGVEGPKTAEGKGFKSILVATINGNTSGEDNLGGQIEEKWEPISKWLAFFNPVAKLDLPEVPLVETGVEPDLEVAEDTGEAAAPGVGAPAPFEPTDVSGLEEGEIATEPVLPTPAESDVPVEVPESPPPPEMEETAPVQELALEGSSDEAMVGFTEASPSQIARTEPVLGEKLDEKIGQEKQDEVQNAPVLSAQTSGQVEEGITPPDQIPVPAEKPITDGVTGADPGDLQATPHSNIGQTPSNESSEKLLDEQEEGGFLGWLRNNIKSFLSRIRTKDPGLNTSAGERPNVRLEGESDPGRMQAQRGDAEAQLQSQRDQTTTALKNHPGQQNIQPRKVHEEKTAELSPEVPVQIESTEDPGAADYAAAALPADVRAKADELLQPKLESNLSEARTKTEQSAQKKDSDKKAEIETAEAQAAKINQKAEQDQRDIVVENRKKVAAQQKEGIEGAYGHLNQFNQDADGEQKTARTAIAEKVKDSEGKAKQELEKGETDAEKKKIEGEKEAADKKEELEKEQEKGSWWDRAVSAVKKAVKAITSAIDAIFTKLRDAVKTIIEKAKNAAIGLINAARDWVVDKLNKFRDWAKGMVDKYLKEHFPGLAKRINAGIDAAVDIAVEGVNFVADSAIAGVEALADSLAAALDKILEIYQTALKAAVQIAGAVITGDFAEALRIAIRAACDIAGIDSKPIFDFIDRAAAQIMDILKHPGRFFNNLMAAVGGGVRNFFKNIKKHLISGLIGWLTGALSEVAITLPEKFDVQGIFSLVMQILGLTYENIKAKVIKRFPPAAKVFSIVEKGFEIVKKLVTQGPVALWEEAKNALSNLKEMVLSGIRDFVITTVVKEAITWLLGLLNPAGAIVKIVKLLFDFVMFLVERFQQIKDFVMSVYDSIAAIASGAIGKATQAVEDALARSLPVVIGLLASLAGLGGIGKTVKGLIAKVSKPVQKVVDKIIDKIIKFVKKLLAKGKAAAKKVKEKLVDWWKAKTKFKGKDGASHTLYFKGSGASAKLTVKSEPQPYTAFLDWAGAQQSTPKQEQALKQARLLAKAIEEETRKPLEGDTEEKKKVSAEKKKTKIEGLLTDLRTHTQELFGKDLPKWNAKTDYPVNGAGFGTQMTGPVLTTQDMPKGSGPTQAKHDVYDKLNKRRAEGGANYYVRGHLLNDNLGGPGQWTNMTPLSRTGNHQHESQAESVVKAGVFSGAIMEYNVKPAYRSRSGADTLIKEARKGRSSEAGKDLEEIIHAEDFVPEELEIKFHRLEPEGASGFKKVKSKEFNVKNPVERTAGSYHLSDSRKVEPVRINDLKSAEPLQNPLLPKGLRNYANRIFQAVEAREKEKKPDFGTYRTLAEEIPGLTEPKLKEWNENGYIIL